MWKGLPVWDVCGVPEGLRYSRFSRASKASVLPERQNTSKLRANNLLAVARRSGTGRAALVAGGTRHANGCQARMQVMSSSQSTGNQTAPQKRGGRGVASSCCSQHLPASCRVNRFPRNEGCVDPFLICSRWTPEPCGREGPPEGPEELHRWPFNYRHTPEKSTTTFFFRSKGRAGCYGPEPQNNRKLIPGAHTAGISHVL